MNKCRSDNTLLFFLAVFLTLAEPRVSRDAVGNEHCAEGEVSVRECLGPSEQRVVLVPGSPGEAEMLDLRPECALQALHLSGLHWIREF